MPLTMDYLMAWGDDWSGDAPAELVATINDLPKDKGEEVVILSRVMPHDVNMGYHDYREEIISAVNGQKVNNLKQLIEILRGSEKSPYVKFITGDRKVIVLNSVKAAEAMPEIMEIYNIPSDRSQDLF